jgi:FlaA1/EpsC-like NDP-sugar epimerase
MGARGQARADLDAVEQAPFSTRVATSAARVRVEATAALLDAVLIAGGYCFVMLVRTLGDASRTQWGELLRFLPVAVVLTLAVAWAWGLYAQIWRHASVAEARRVLLAGITSAVVVTTVSLAVGGPFPLPVSLLGAMAVTMLLGAIRFQSRLFAFNRRQVESNGMRVAVLGAGEAAAELVRSMRRDSRSGLVPVVMFDDDERTHGRACSGVPVVGGFESLPDVVATTELHQVILAAPSAPVSTVRRAADLADRVGLPLRVLPPVHELIGGQVRTSAVRDLRIDDLLGRNPIHTDLASVRALLEGRRVLVTGAGGSIGSEIARQVAGCRPSSLLLLEHDETHLHELMATLPEDAQAVPLLADVRHRDHIAKLFARHRPEVVFHAAAHKHVPLLEAHPSEAVKTNVMGTRNVVDAAVAADTARFVSISTDKAVAPSSVMGASKRLGELMTLDAGTEDRHYCAVRFGNVLGSRGSVIPTFIRQIESGGPVTVTDARMTRFFMSIPEAVQLVLQAAAMSTGGEIFMLEMGEPVRIIDLAKRMIRLAGLRPGADVEVRVTGVRPGEKLTEELRTPAEAPNPTTHSSIVALTRDARASSPDAQVLELLVRAAVRGDDSVARTGVFALVQQADGCIEAGRKTVLDVRPRTPSAAEQVAWTSSTT